MTSSPRRPPVSEVVRGRADSGQRTDGYRLALVIEGGGSRGVYSGGMVSALAELGLDGIFDAVYGTSAGALNGAWLLCGRTEAGKRAWIEPSIVRRVVDPARLLRGGPAFDTRFLVHRVYDGIAPMDFPAILTNPTTFHPVGTDIVTGRPTDLRRHIVDKHTLMTALRATTNLPILAGAPIRLDDREYLDGGIAEAVPIRMAVRDGATHALVLRTRRTDEPRPPAPRLHQLVGGSYLRVRAPGAFRSWRRRDAITDAEERYLDDLGDTVLQIRPPAGSPTVPGADRDTDRLAIAHEIGRRAIYECADLAGIVAAQ